MNKYIFDEKESEAALLNMLYESLEELKDEIEERGNTEYYQAKVRALEKIQNYLSKYYD